MMEVQPDVVIHDDLNDEELEPDEEDEEEEQQQQQQSRPDENGK